MKLEGLDHVALTVSNVSRSARWYQDTLGFEHMHPGQWDDVPTMVGTGGTCLALFPVQLQEASASRTSMDRIEVQHIAFRATRANFDAARRELEAKGVPTEFEDHGISHSIYFMDPDGHRLEITTYDVRAEFAG